MDDPNPHTPVPASADPPPIEVGNQKTLANDPLPILLHGKPTVMYPVQKHELRSIGGSTLVASILAGIAGACSSAYQTYSTALQNKELDVQTVSDYKTFAGVGKYGMVICGLVYMLAMGNVWLGIRRIKKSESLFIWAEGRLIPVDRGSLYPLTRWDKLKAKFYHRYDTWLDKSPR